MSSITIPSPVSVVAPTMSTHATNKSYVDTNLALRLAKAGGMLTGATWVQPHALTIVDQTVLGVTTHRVAVDCSMSNTHTLSLTNTDDVVIDDPTNLSSGCTYVFVVKNTVARGAATMTFGSSYKFAGGVLPAFNATSGAINVVTAICDPFDSTKLLCVFQANFQ